MYSDLARTVLLGGDEEQLDLEIRRILEKHPDADRYEVADRLVSRAMARCASVGAIASIPAGVLAGLPAAADMAFQVRTLHRLALGIARARRKETTAVDRAVAAVGALAIASAARVFREGMLAGSRRAIGRRAPRLVPLAGALAGAVSGALAAWAAGRLAREALSRR
jgi:hypothetical protein